MASEKILVTGGTGRLGRVVVRQLLERGHKLRLIVRSAAKARELFAKTGYAKKIELAEADLADGSPASMKKILEACKGTGVAVHLAAQVDANASEEELFRSNLDATVHLLEACSAGKAKRFVFCSSTSVYKKVLRQPINESHPFTPTNAYGLSKVAAEAAVRASGIPFVILRPPLIYGPGFDTGFGSVVRMIRKKKMVVVGNGKNRIALVHVEDAARAFVLATEAGKKVENQDFIISGESVEQGECLRLVAQALKVPAPKVHVPKRVLLAGAAVVEKIFPLLGKKPFVRREYVDTLGEDRVFSIKKAEKLLGWTAKIKLAGAIKGIETWF